MNWISAYFSEKVCNLLAGSTVSTLQNSLSSRTWNNAAARMLEKRDTSSVCFLDYQIGFGRRVEEIKSDPHRRVISLGFDVYQTNPEFDDNLAEILPFVAFDDSSELKFNYGTNKNAVKTAMKLFNSERFKNNCLFTRVVNLQRVSDASETFLKRCIAKRVLKSLRLCKGWKGTDADWIQDLFSQEQLIEFDADHAQALCFGDNAISMLLATIPDRTAQSRNRCYSFRRGFRARGIRETKEHMAELMAKVGFEKPAKSKAKYHSTFYRGNATINVHTGDPKLSLRVEYKP